MFLVRRSGHRGLLYLENSTFSLNKAVPLYIVNHNVHISGDVLFEGNEAQNGGGIYISGHTELNLIITQM